MEDIKEIVRKQVEKANYLLQKETQELCGLSTFESPLSEDVTSHHLLKKFVMSSFECYSGATDPIQHLCQYQDKIAIHSHDDLLLSRVFPSSLKALPMTGCIHS